MTANPMHMIYLLVALSAIILLAGMVMRKRGVIGGRRAGLALAVLSVLPLFGAGVIFRTVHGVERATGEQETYQINSNAT